MSMDFFRIYRGLELDEAAQFLTGTTAPGASGDTATAPRGSYFTDTSTGGLYLKTSTGSGTDKWSQMATQTYVNGVAALGLSWREPVAVADFTYTTLADIVNDLNADDAIQGVSVYANMRILAAGVTGNKNIFIVSGSSGNWILTEDGNSESVGDTVYVIGGTDASKTFNYSATGDWVWINSGDQTELAFLRSFVGKDSNGNVMPVYSSTNIVIDSTSLETAIGALDAALFTAQGDITDLTTEQGYQNTFMGKTAGNEMPDWTTANYITASNDLVAAVLEVDSRLFTTTSDLANANAEIGYIDTYLGKTAGSNMPAFTANNFVVDGDTILASIEKIDVELGANVSDGFVILAANKINGNITALDGAVQTVSNAIGAAVVDGFAILAANTVNQNITALDGAVETVSTDLAAANTEIGYINTFIGKTAGNDTPNYSSNVFVADSTSLETAIGALDAAVASSSLTTQALATTTVALDSVAAISAEWIVYVRDTGTPSTARAVKVFAMQNGAVADYTTFGMLNTGTIAGLDITVTFSAGNLVLNVSATGNIDVKAQRVAAIAAFV